MMMILKVTIVSLLGILLVVTGTDDFTSHCDRCKCKWAGGKKSADCRSLSFSDIPTTLSSELRDIDFSFNPLYELKARDLSTANLSDVHKLKFQNCSIGDINFTAFEGLSLLIELDLSHNNIRRLSPKVFHTNTKLRIINLAYNNLSNLESGLFENMTHLQRVLLNNNAIKHISSDVFGHNCTVLHLDLSYNRLRTVDSTFLDYFPKISSLTLAGNPWVCDCNLEVFRTLSLTKNLITTNTECQEPERLRGEIWSDNKIVFACEPEVLQLISNVQDSHGEISTNLTMSCKVRAVPNPDINWMSNGRIIDRDPRQNVPKYITTKVQVGDVTWSNLTILSISPRDRGEYKCVATNPGGSAQLNLTLAVRAGGDGGDSPSSSNILIWIICLSVGAVVLLVLVFVLICFCCKRNGRDNNIISKNRRLSQSNEFISLDGHANDMGKSLITEVNPVVKPPRQYSVPQSVTSGGTEVSETKKMLIDDDSMYDDESRSLDYDSRYQQKTPNHRIIDYRGEGHYPPDLLSFPPHAIPQVSPAGSSASTVVVDSSRLPAQYGPQSPLHSPLYDNMYRTLPYSRSHSPFTSPHGLPVRVPRQGGYVTIPRRPRQSWSSEPPPSSETSEPLYDNLGLRTTATGSSVLSLNRIGVDNATPKASTPKGNGRPPHPLSPNLISSPCDPIAEQESPPTAATLPRSASAHRALSPNADLMRANWTRSPEPVDSRRESTASLLPTPDGKTPKIPPRPPPKPKKRASTGPLFEDEGEDGTEV